MSVTVTGTQLAQSTLDANITTTTGSSGRTVQLDVHPSAVGIPVTSSADVLVGDIFSIGSFIDVHISATIVALDVLVSPTIVDLLDMEVPVALSPYLSATLDMWVSIGGAASQLFQLDTSVATPLIVGDHVVSDENPSVTFSLINLDEDVVSLLVGPSAIGVVSVSGFVNNGDGTGTFIATFDTSVAVRELTIIAVDDVDNESAESPFHIVNSLEQAKLNDVLSIAPQSSVSTSTCQRLIDSVPDSNFTLKRQHTVPYSFGPTVFEIRSITPNAPVEVVVSRRGLPGEPDETQRYVVIPSTAVQLISIRLGRGTNIVSVFDSYGRADTAIVAATTYAAVLCSYAREFYNISGITVEEQSNAIFSPTGTRLAEPLLTFQDLLPDVRSQQILAAKLAIRSLVSGSGRQIGVRDILAALALSTPIFVAQNPDEQYFDPIARPMFNSHEAFGGVEAHVWIANACVQRWLAFINYISNSDAFQLLSIQENEVVFRDENNDLQRHVFDFTAEECSLTRLALQALCFDTIDVNITIQSEQDIRICAAAYPLDLRPVPLHPVHFLADEYGVELALDPGFDGYVDVSLTRHWDRGRALDSMGAMPAQGSSFLPCLYDEGYLIRPILLASVSSLIDAAPDLEIVYDVETARSVDLDILMSGIVKQYGFLDVNVRDSLPTQSRSLVIDGIVKSTEHLTLELGVLISA
jgi:hypothetical protein